MTPGHNAVADDAAELTDKLMACVSEHLGGNDNADARVILIAFGNAAGCYAHSMNNPEFRRKMVRHFVDTFIECAGVPLAVVERS